MRDYISIGSSPIDESCQQVGSEDYTRKAKIECRHYMDALRKKLGPEPEGARLYIKGNPHDFGTYYEVNCEFDDGNEEATAYAFKCEGEGPTTWEEVGMTAPNFDKSDTLKALDQQLEQDLIAYMRAGSEPTDADFGF